MRKESRDWWGTKTWLIHTLLWLAVVDGLALGAILLTFDPAYVAGLSPKMAGLLADRTTIPLTCFFQAAGIALALGVVVLAQEELIGDRQSGTVAWTLSKPVTRTAFFLSKLLGNLPAIVGLMVLLPGAVCYAMVSIYRASPLPVLGFLGGLGVVLLELLFYLSLTLMLGTLFRSRGPVIGVPLLLVLGFSFLPLLLPASSELLPYALTNQIGDWQPIAPSLVMGLPIPSLMPLVTTAVWSLLFLAVGIWRFRSEEF